MITFFLTGHDEENKFGAMMTQDNSNKHPLDIIKDIAESHGCLKETLSESINDLLVRRPLDSSDSYKKRHSEISSCIALHHIEAKNCLIKEMLLGHDPLMAAQALNFTVKRSVELDDNSKEDIIIFCNNLDLDKSASIMTRCIPSGLSKKLFIDGKTSSSPLMHLAFKVSKETHLIPRFVNLMFKEMHATKTNPKDHDCPLVIIYASESQGLSDYYSDKIKELELAGLGEFAKRQFQSLASDSELNKPEVKKFLGYNLDYLKKLGLERKKTFENFPQFYRMTPDQISKFYSHGYRFAEKYSSNAIEKLNRSDDKVVLYGIFSQIASKSKRFLTFSHCYDKCFSDNIPLSSVKEYIFGNPSRNIKAEMDYKIKQWDAECSKSFISGMSEFVSSFIKSFPASAAATGVFNWFKEQDLTTVSAGSMAALITTSVISTLCTKEGREAIGWVIQNGKRALDFMIEKAENFGYFMKNYDHNYEVVKRNRPLIPGIRIDRDDEPRM